MKAAAITPARADLELALQQTQRVDRDTAIKVVKARQEELNRMLEAAEQLADRRVPGLIAAARDSGRELLGHEIERLVALQQVNPGVRDDEIEFFRKQLRSFRAGAEPCAPAPRRGARHRRRLG